MMTMVVTKIPPVLQGDFDPIKLFVDNLNKYLLLYYLLSCYAQKTCLSALFFAHYIFPCPYILSPKDLTRARI